MADVFFAVLFYIFLLVGSFSLGYLVLRFVYPEIRTFEKRSKMITVGIVGAAISLSTIALDYSISGPRILSLDSFSMPLMFITTLFYFLILRVYFLYTSVSREFITVGIPIATSMSMPSLPALKKFEKPSGIPTQARKLEQPRDLSKKIEEIKKRIEEKKIEKPVEVKAVASTSAELEKLERKIMEKMEKEKTSEVKKLQEEKRQLQRKLEEETAKREAEKVNELKRLEEEKRSFEAKLAGAQKSQEEKQKMEVELKRLEADKKKLQVEFQEELKKREEELKKVTTGRKKAEEEEKLEDQKRLEVERKRLEEEKKKLQKQFDEELKKREAELTKKLGEEKKTAVEEEKKRGESLKKLEEQQRLQTQREAEERKKRLKLSIGDSETYLEKIKQRVDALKKISGKKIKKEAETLSSQLSLQAVKSEGKIAQLKKESILEPVEVKLEVKTVAPLSTQLVQSETQKKVDEIKRKIEVRKAAEVAGVQLPVAVMPKTVEKKPSGFFDSIFGGKTETKALGTKVSEMGTWRKVNEEQQKKSEERKKEEQKKTEERKKVLEEKKKEEAELEQLLKTVTREAEEKAEQTTGEGSPVHRRYLLKGQVKVVASKEVAQKEEFGYMVQDVYSQLRSSQSETSVADVLKVDAPKAQVAAKLPMQKSTSGKEDNHLFESKPVSTVQVAKPEAGVSVSDILGTDLFGPSKSPEPSHAGELFAPETAPISAGGGDIFAQLSAASSGAPIPQVQTPVVQPVVKSDVSFVQIQAEKGVGCPTCHAKSSKIIFCPYCSTGMCANCSPSIKPLAPGQFVYVCPKCGEEVSVKKKAG